MTSCLPVCGFKTSPCVRSKRPRVYRHHAHMFQHMCAWCRHSRRRFQCTHGGVLEANTGFSTFFSVPQHTHTHTPHQAHTTTTNNTTTTTTRRERERERDRERGTEKERQEKMKEERQDKGREEKRREEKRREKRED